MEGPTPVSALIHAATMVTAGVFLIVRCSSLFELSSLALFFMLLVGSSTAFAAATVGVVQNDIKKIIAYSTCSQLGYMVLICGLSGYAVGLFHLVNHAFFKALLFLSAGSLIHGVSDEQDLRRFGGLTRLFPFTYAMFIAGSVALTAAPFTTGFYSKDLILELTLALFSAKAAFAYCTALVVAMFTSVYSVRLLLLSFFGSTNSSRSYLNNTHEANAAMATAVIPLGLGGVFWGYIAHELFVGVGSSV
jgi:NADH-ubiquinone oxidoreductase chain 5